MWDGEGFPPVGTKCEFNYFGSWFKGEVMFSCNNGCLIAGVGLGVAINNLSHIRPIKAEWDGEGFPPVGTECEFKYFGSWVRGEVIASDKNRFCVTNGDYGLSASNLSDVRPLRTERQMTQGDMLDIARANPAASMIELFGLFYDAGYRK